MQKAQHYLDEDFPNLIQYFVDESKSHKGSLSKEVVGVICPCCNREHNKSIRTIYASGNTYCPMCNDNYSFPERFMTAILNNLNIKYKYQFTDSWTKRYKYDFQFDINCHKYILELDGGLGHGHKKDLDNRSPEESKNIDIIKDNLASKNGFNIIRIDCYYNNKNRYDVIKTNILNSELKYILDLSQVDWDMCFSNACSSRYHQILQLYNNGCKYLNDISKEVGLSVGSVKHFLLSMMHSGIIKRESLYKENPIPDLQIPIIANQKYFGNGSTPVYCYEDAIYFRTTQDADDYYGFSRFSVRNCISSYSGYCNGKHFVKFENLPEDFDYKPKFFSDDKYREHAYCQWSLDGKLENIYINKKNLPNEYKYLAVQRVINGTFNTAYGYKWSILPKELEYQFIKEKDVIERPILLERFQRILKGE